MRRGARFLVYTPAGPRIVSAPDEPLDEFSSTAADYANLVAERMIRRQQVVETRYGEASRGFLRLAVCVLGAVAVGASGYLLAIARHPRADNGYPDTYRTYAALQLSVLAVWTLCIWAALWQKLAQAPAYSECSCVPTAAVVDCLSLACFILAAVILLAIVDTHGAPSDRFVYVIGALIQVSITGACFAIGRVCFAPQ